MGLLSLLSAGAAANGANVLAPLLPLLDQLLFTMGTDDDDSGGGGGGGHQDPGSSPAVAGASGACSRSGGPVASVAVQIAARLRCCVVRSSLCCRSIRTLARVE